ncbi:MAG: phosphoribosylglycinamide formyltransferase [Candidatus Altiarchaeota archaeon]
MANIGVLSSGRGSNLQAIIDSVESEFIPRSRIVAVISDKADAYALERAKSHGIEALHVDPEDFMTRQEYDRKVADLLIRRKTDLVLLAGYMRIVTPVLLDAFKNRVMNIHPALLPSFPGLHAQKQAIEYGVKVAGCTVHFVDSEVDHGPIIVQAAVPVLEDDTEESLAKRILEQEHLIYPQAVQWFAEGRLKVAGRKVRVRGLKQAGKTLRVI